MLPEDVDMNLVYIYMYIYIYVYQYPTFLIEPCGGRIFLLGSWASTVQGTMVDSLGVGGLVGSQRLRPKNPMQLLQRRLGGDGRR